MAKAYWVATYYSISDRDAWAEYARIAVPAINAAGGRFLARPQPRKPTKRACLSASSSSSSTAWRMRSPSMTARPIRPL